MKKYILGLFDKMFNRIKINKIEAKEVEVKNYLSDAEIEQRNKEFASKFKQLEDLFTSCLNTYNNELCQCAYPRFQQMISIDLLGTGHSFMCYDTELLIDLSKKYFDIEKSKIKDENTNERWVCKKCKSTYEYGWSDFSIYVQRQKLTLINLKIKPIGKIPSKPIPLYLGLMGHSYPARTEITNVSFEEFANYMTEK